MKLDHTTYEAWLLDRSEGALSPGQERELDAFLLANPSLSADIGDLPSIDPQHVVPMDLGPLKRELPPSGSPTAYDLDDHLVARGEGDLRPDQEKALVEFLRVHPERELDARRMAAARIVASEQTLPAEHRPYRTFPPSGIPDQHRILDFLIAELEGDLDEPSVDTLHQYLKEHPELEKDLRLVRATRVEAVEVAFPWKAQLKKEARVLPLWSVAARWAAAASVVLLVGLSWMLLRGNADNRLATEVPVVSPVEVTVEPEQNLSEPESAPEPDERDVTTAPASTHSPELKRSAPADAKPAPKERKLKPRTPELQLVQPSAPVWEALAEEPETPTVVGAEDHELPEPITESTPAASAVSPEAYTVRELLVTTMRERILDDPTPGTQPLDANDAVAAVDRGLSGLSGGTAGLSVTERSGRRRFDLRLGRGLAISASKGL